MQKTLLFNQAGQPVFSSEQVAAQMGIPRRTIITIVFRHPELKPAIQVGNNFYWTEGEIAELAAKKAVNRPGRPAKN